MTAPIAVCDVAAAAGALLVPGTVVSVVGTVIVPRKSGSRLTRLVASATNRENKIALLNSRAGSPSWGRNCWPGPTMRSALAPRPWIPAWRPIS
jgi:hypothetical protein